MNDPARERIVTALATMTDPNMKAVLLLLLAVLEELGDKIEALRADEQGLRESVLNGHSATHGADHDWVTDRRAARCEEVCSWAKAKMAEEQEEANANKTSKRKIRDGLAERLLWALLLAVAGAGWWLK